ncbi:DUF2807 domain-containing protein [Hymenobacter busanensis]|uniref:DUF2807 domain-containing protein n=1 Tax=Hymenobacter busanensis TaxID=2607656 RepID=A0A7L5A3Z2_9BACT|nr:head GIN domain-containing protein [Hymenobacter busanensis]KAA9331588.1 DUF2807 domain-containing protein [Hymenobacter busanensis]QHJ08740.1 hypothetical protein GUY19_16185 [Hymenobacter busanensis]
MKTNWLFLLLFSVLLFSACSDDHWGPRIRGAGPTESQTRTLPAISRVELKINADVIITQGPQQEVRIEAQRNILDVLETEMSGDQLQIEFGRYDVRGHDPIKIYITTPKLTEVEVSGSGKIHSGSAWSAPSFAARVSGSGEADLNFAQVESLRTSISGSGELRLNGTAQVNTVNISGSGKVYAYDLSTQDTYINISGSGKGYVRASRTLDADISGSGTVHYRGTPSVNSRISGSGKVLADK